MRDKIAFDQALGQRLKLTRLRLGMISSRKPPLRTTPGPLSFQRCQRRAGNRSPGVLPWIGGSGFG
jgi:hypothetical protein